MGNNMNWKGKYKSEILMVCHMDAKAMHEVGAISDQEMQEYDKDCLVSLPKSEIVSSLNQSSIPVFANPK
jgi:DNA-binding transcriptional regulator YiaG